MKTALKEAIRRSSLYPIAKEIYRRTLNREFLLSRRQLMSFYGKLVQKGAVVFDVGANRGDFTDAFLRLGAHVYAFEPHPTCTRELRALYSGNPRFHLVDVALGSEPGEAKLYLGENGMDNVSTLSEDYKREAAKLPGLAVAGWTKSLSVKVSTLDQMIAEYGTPAFCKIDVEGYELPVLKGLHQIIPLLQFEYQPWSVDKAIECIDYLEGLGYQRFNLTMSASRSDIVALQADWMSAAQLIEILRLSVASTHRVGDVFAKPGHD
ncbi:MAG: FkbM family methyltransferase [Pseudomonadota bacterium]